MAGGRWTAAWSWSGPRATSGAVSAQQARGRLAAPCVVPGPLPGLTTCPSPLPAATVDLPVGSTAEYKLVHYRPGGAPVWEFCPNRVLAVTPAAAELAVGLGWNDPEASAVMAPGIDAPSTEAEPEEEKAQPAFQAAADAVDAFAEQMRSAMGAAVGVAAPVAAEASLVLEPEHAVLTAEEVEAEAAAALEDSAEGEAATVDFLKVGLFPPTRNQLDLHLSGC